MSHSCALLGGFAIGARIALLWQHYGNAWQSLAEIHRIHRRQHASEDDAGISKHRLSPYNAYYHNWLTLNRPTTRRTHGVRRRLPSPAIKSTRLLRAPFHLVHTAGVL